MQKYENLEKKSVLNQHRQKTLERITRKAIYNRYEGLFYAWKL